MGITALGHTGRPTKYTEELAARICAQLAVGYSLRTVSREEWCPSRETIYRWIRENSTFRDQYALAKEDAADALAEDMIDIADDGSNDYMEKLDSEGNSVGWQLNGEHVQRSKLRVDARKWYLSKIKPKKYGDRISQEITGKNGGPVEVEDKSGLEVARRLAFILTKAAKETD